MHGHEDGHHAQGPVAEERWRSHGQAGLIMAGHQAMDVKYDPDTGHGGARRDISLWEASKR
jgi:hypothetical protein